MIEVKNCYFLFSNGINKRRCSTETLGNPHRPFGISPLNLLFASLNRRRLVQFPYTSDILPFSLLLITLEFEAFPHYRVGLVNERCPCYTTYPAAGSGKKVGI